MRDKPKISVVVPTLNEAANIRPLVERLHQVLKRSASAYELVFVDDRSTDGTFKLLQKLASSYPIKTFLKTTTPGKAYSLIQGFGEAQYEIVAFIDADLQYPPEALEQMIQKIMQGADVVVGNRDERNIHWLRRFMSLSFRFVFGRLLHGFSLDVQAGLKVFRRQVLSEFTIHPTPWTFDLEFLIKAREHGFAIASVDIVYESRHAGSSKISLAKAIFEIGWNALALKFRFQSPEVVPATREQAMIGAGVVRQGKRFITHTTLPWTSSALMTASTTQKLILFDLILLMALGLYLSPQAAMIGLMGVLSLIYFIDVVFNWFVVAQSLNRSSEIRIARSALDALKDNQLPMYTILCPLYREANVLPNFVHAIEALDWPKNKLDVILLLEEDDADTQAVAQYLHLPEYFRTLVVPDSQPKTKPKACNYGLNFAQGEYLVVYDAEDIPDREQLKKAYLGFLQSPPDVKCLQSKLNYHNPEQNLLTRLFTAEYSLWFDVILPGLQSINGSIPLGGTSNHFKTEELIALEGWDAFNVTEDCDLGTRLFNLGHRTAIIDSTTLEEANSSLRNWIRQRSRWIKGYLQTYLVHARAPATKQNQKLLERMTFHFVVGGKIAFMLVNPILWLATIAYFALYTYVGPAIESFYPTPVFYMAGISLVFGNFMCLYYYMIGTARRGHWALMKYIFLVPLYWLAASWAAYIALWQLVFNPHYWEKTHHGLTPKPKKILQDLPVSVLKQSPSNSLVPKSPAPTFGAMLSSGSVMVGAIMVANFANFIFNAFLGRVLTFEQLGLVTLVNTLFFIASIFFSALSSTINQRSSYLHVSSGREESLAFWRSALKKALNVGIGAAFVWLVATPLLTNFFRMDSPVTFLLFTPILFMGVINSGNRGLMNGQLLFARVGMLVVAEAFIKLLVAGILVWHNLPEYAYLSIPVSIAVAALISLGVVPKSDKNVQPSHTEYSFPVKFYMASLFTGIASLVFLSLDILLVKHYLDPLAAGEYALLALVGKMIYFFGSLPNAFTMTFVSRDVAQKRNPIHIFRILFASTVALVVAGFAFLGPFGAQTVPLLLGEKTRAILPYLTLYTLAIGFYTIASSMVNYHLALKNYSFPVASLFVSIFMTIGIILRHENIGQVTLVVFTSSALGLSLTMFLHFFAGKYDFVRRNLRDLLDLFFGAIPQINPHATSRILMFNWRDIKHVYSGGAEVYIQEIAKQWVEQGSAVTIFCGNDGKSARFEQIDGVQIVRRGGFYTVYIWAMLYYLLRMRNCYDVIIDSHNGVPFFTPIYAGETIYCLMHHVHQEVFRRSLPRPLAWFASFLEKDLMPVVYRNVKFITVSESSKKDIKRLGLGRKGIEIVNPGVNLDQLGFGKKSKAPSVLYLGRLKAYKSVDVLLRAFAIVKNRVPQARLVIAGSGEESGRLQSLAQQLQIDSDVEFTGKVSEVEKISLMQRAWVFVNPSYMEGWGITTIEANACGTPAVASDVPGLRDSVKNPHTGFLVPPGDTNGFAERIVKLLENETLRAQMGSNALAWAQRFDWSQSSTYFWNIINPENTRN